MGERGPLIAFLIAAALGTVFAGFSTYDFVQHLDRQVHDIHCSFVPGVVASEPGADSGCQVALMSPYSSIFRRWVWGGIPISLPGMLIFAFLLFRGADMWMRPPGRRRAAGAFLTATSLVPVGASVVMGFIAVTELGAVCKVCMGMYVCSAIALVAAILAWRWAPGPDAAVVTAPAPAPVAKAAAAKKTETPRHGADEDVEGDWTFGETDGEAGTEEEPEEEPQRGAVASDRPARDEPPMRAPAGAAGAAATSAGMTWLWGVGQLGAFMLLPLALYLIIAPDFSGFIGSCGDLPKAADTGGVLIPAGGSGPEAIEVFDPLCPACKAFEERLASSGLEAELTRKLVLFPLDDQCNWMITTALHPGACSVSEAVVCAADDANVDMHAVIAWSFDNQDEIRTAAAADPAAAKNMVVTAFPGLKGCVGSPKAKAKINKSLRWAVANSLPVLTPQLYVAGKKLCDEDTDLGMEYALSRMLEGAGAPAGGGR